MKERETTQPSIWEKLTPSEALGLAERILCGIENGEFPRGIYEPIVDRLIEFACGDKNSNSSSESQVGQNTVLQNKDQKPPKNNKTPHSLGLSQLPPAQRTLSVSYTHLTLPTNREV